MTKSLTIVECTYDYGSTTTLYRKVFSIKPTIAKNLMNYYFGNAEAKTEKSVLEDLQSMPLWIDGNEIKSNTVITEFDTYLGPNNPGPKEPTCLSTEEDCVPVLQSNDKKKLVTAMSINGGREWRRRRDENGSLSR